MVVLLHSSDYVSLVFSLTSFSYDLFVPYDSIYGYWPLLYQNEWNVTV